MMDVYTVDIWKRLKYFLATGRYLWFFPWLYSLVGLDLLLVEASRSHSDTSYSVGLLWPKWSARRRELYPTTHNTYRRQPSMSPADVDPRLRLRVHQDRHIRLYEAYRNLNAVVNINFSVNFKARSPLKLLDPWRWRRYGPSKRRESRLQRRSLIYYKTWILTHIDLRVPLVATFMLRTDIRLLERI